MAELANLITKAQFIKPDPITWNLGNDIHIWKFPVMKMEFPLLSESEKEIAGRYRFEEDSNRFSGGRQGLRLLLSKYLSVSPSEIDLFADIGRKPVIQRPLSEIHFNISHSGEWVLIAFANMEIGIDIEKVDPDFKYQDLVTEHFNESEQMLVSGSRDPVSEFYYIWTRKESLIKARGVGLQENLKGVNALNEITSFDIQKADWKVKSFKVSVNYFSAIAHSYKIENIFYFEGGFL